MSDLVCPRCRRASADGLLCRDCLAHGRDQLRKIARHWNDVYVRKTGSGGTSRGYASRVPVTDGQTKVLAYVRNQLSTWVRELDLGDAGEWVAECRCEPYRACPGHRRWIPLAGDPATWALWLAARTQRIASHAAGDEAIDEFDYCAGLVIRAINPRHTLTGCGKCPVCGSDVFAVDDDPVGVCRRCAEAGVESTLHRLSQRGDLWARVPDRPLPRRLLIEALPMFGLRVKPSTFRQWVFQERLKPVGEENGAPLYRVSDVRILLETDVA